MTGSHVTVTLGDGSGDGDVAVLSVHVVGSTTGVVTNPHTKVLHRGLILLKDLFTGNNLSDGFLQFLQLLHVVPESGFGSDNIRSKDPHAKNWRLGVFLCWDTSSDDFEFLQLSETLHSACVLNDVFYLISV